MVRTYLRLISFEVGSYRKMRTEKEERNGRAQARVFAATVTLNAAAQAIGGPDPPTGDPPTGNTAKGIGTQESQAGTDTVATQQSKKSSGKADWQYEMHFKVLSSKKQIVYEWSHVVDREKGEYFRGKVEVGFDSVIRINIEPLDDICCVVMLELRAPPLLSSGQQRWDPVKKKRSGCQWQKNSGADPELVAQCKASRFHTVVVGNCKEKVDKEFSALIGPPGNLGITKELLPGSQPELAKQAFGLTCTLKPVQLPSVKLPSPKPTKSKKRGLSMLASKNTDGTPTLKGSGKKGSRARKIRVKGKENSGAQPNVGSSDLILEPDVLVGSKKKRRGRKPKKAANSGGLSLTVPATSDQNPGIAIVSPIRVGSSAFIGASPSPTVYMNMKLFNDMVSPARSSADYKKNRPSRELSPALAGMFDSPRYLPKSARDRARLLSKQQSDEDESIHQPPHPSAVRDKLATACNSSFKKPVSSSSSSSSNIVALGGNVDSVTSLKALDLSMDAFKAAARGLLDISGEKDNLVDQLNSSTSSGTSSGGPSCSSMTTPIKQSGDGIAALDESSDPEPLMSGDWASCGAFDRTTPVAASRSAFLDCGRTERRDTMHTPLHTIMPATPTPLKHFSPAETPLLLTTPRAGTGISPLPLNSMSVHRESHQSALDSITRLSEQHILKPLLKLEMPRPATRDFVFGVSSSHRQGQEGVGEPQKSVIFELAPTTNEPLSERFELIPDIGGRPISDLFNVAYSYSEWEGCDLPSAGPAVEPGSLPSMPGRKRAHFVVLLLKQKLTMVVPNSGEQLFSGNPCVLCGMASELFWLDEANSFFTLLRNEYQFTAQGLVKSKTAAAGVLNSVLRPHNMVKDAMNVCRLGHISMLYEEFVCPPAPQ